ncbi:MAG TPA: hypothetical protein PLO65_04610 [Caulobacter sp.]|nr:hypothetical protein [Caulobacter sp.]
MGLAGEEIEVADVDEVALAARLAGEFFVRGVEIVARAHGGDLLRGIIFTAIAVANSEAAPMTGGGARRPVSVMSIAHSIGVPYETTRRYVNMLVADGLCVREGRRGVIVPEQALLRPELEAAYRETFVSFNRLATALRRMSYAPA